MDLESTLIRYYKLQTEKLKIMVTVRSEAFNILKNVLLYQNMDFWNHSTTSSTGPVYRDSLELEMSLYPDLGKSG